MVRLEANVMVSVQTGLPASLLRAPIVRDDDHHRGYDDPQHQAPRRRNSHDRNADYGGNGSAGASSNDPYIQQLRKQNELAQQQLAAAQQALRAKGFQRSPSGEAADEDEESDLLRAVGMHPLRTHHDALDVERRRMASRGGAVAIRPSSGYGHYGQSRPQPAQASTQGMMLSKHWRSAVWAFHRAWPGTREDSWRSTRQEEIVVEDRTTRPTRLTITMLPPKSTARLAAACDRSPT